jgi:hypothetical protein
MINDEEEEPVDWKLYFASLTDRKLYDFWEIIKKEMANRNWKNLPELVNHLHGVRQSSAGTLTVHFYSLNPLTSTHFYFFLCWFW